MNRKLAICINLFIGLMSFGSWIFMAVLTIEGDTLAANGFSSLKFFTVLSNLMNGLIALIYAGRLIRDKEVTVPLKTAKLAGVSAVTLTFLTVMLMLGPLYGYNTMFNGSNLWMHLVLPLLSIFSLLVWERDVHIPSRSILWAVLPVLLYEIGYVLNLIINGIGTFPHSNDFYGFMQWGYGMAAVIAVSILAISCGIAAVFWKLGGMHGYKNQE